MVAGIATLWLLAAQGSAQARASNLDVLPFPGTPDATPQTQISLPAVPSSQIARISVTGSLTGAHPGRIEPAPGAGSTFVPTLPFASGDHVTVRVAFTDAAAGAAAGAPGATDLTYAFSVAAPLPATLPRTSIRALARGTRQVTARVASGTRFRSASGLHPPKVWFSGKVPDPGLGDIFLDAQDSTQDGPMILSPSGRLLWFRPYGHDSVFNFELHQYRGQSVLTYWLGAVGDGYGVGRDVLVNHSYKTIATVRGANGLHPDLHEFQITPQGYGLYTAYEQVHADLSAVGGSSNGTLLDSVVQEVNIATGRLVWEWHAYGHIPITQSYVGKPNANPYDFVHLDSIQQLPNGDLLVSGRDTWAVYEIDPRNGRIVWSLGGKQSSFRMAPGTQFAWQHDARLYGSTLTVFDDGAGYRRTENQSRALRIALNLSDRTAALAHVYTNHPSVLAVSQGNVQALPNGNTFVGWGSAPYFSEFGPTGRQLFTGHFRSPVQSYRAYRFAWSAQPKYQPHIAASATRTGTRVFASWNGATDVATWEVLAGPSSRQLTPQGRYPSRAFETRMFVKTTQPYIQVRALDHSGNVLRASRTVSR